MLGSQFDTLEDLEEGEDGFTVSALGTKEETLQAVEDGLSERGLI